MLDEAAAAAEALGAERDGVSSGRTALL